MERCSFALAAALGLALTAPAAQAQTMVSTSADFSAFTTQFCGADRSAPHIFVLPLSVFQANSSVSCDFGAATMRVTEPASDPGHYVLNIDPPAGVEDGLDCDSKVDEGMDLVALNCLPANLEQAGHRKS